MHCGIHFDIHLLFGAGQQGIHFAIAMLALHQPGLQQDQPWIFQQVRPRQRRQRLFQQTQLAVVEHAPGVVEQNIAQHGGIASGKRMMDGFGGESLRHPRFGGGAVNFR